MSAPALDEGLQLPRWGLCALVVVLAHLAAALIWMRTQPDRLLPPGPPAAIMIQLAPDPAAPPEAQSLEPSQPEHAPPQPTTAPRAEPPASAEPPPAPAPEHAPEPKPEPMAQPRPEPTPEPAVQPRPDPVPEPEPEPAAQPRPDPVPEPKPVAQSPDSPPRASSTRQPVHRKMEPDPVPKQRPAPETRPAAQAAAPPASAAPPTPATAASAPRRDAPAADTKDIVRNWQRLLMRHLEQYKRYPRAAVIRHREGVVYLHFVMNREGEVLSWHIRRSSGYSALDREAKAMIQRAAPLPPPPPEVARARIALDVPIQFVIR